MTALKVVCVTDRKAVRGDFVERIEKLAAAKPHAILLRERDLAEDEYEALAVRCFDICKRYATQLVVHRHAEVARGLGAAVHLPFEDLRRHAGKLDGVAGIGASIHAAQEAREAEALGATHLIAGHIFATGSKPSLAPRGAGFLAEVCRAVALPVFAIGGITPERIPEIAETGAAGVCIMSSAMICSDTLRLIAELAGDAAR